MTLKQELETLRGEPITVFDGDPMAIPCIETSDSEKLCKHPIVSVHMITYNHEPYIRQAIEGVMMQKTDFEFELVIGEDCSQDKTREICLGYQKKYPDKIRVLWWHENVSNLGGNACRVSARCRGEFIAFCEGDDYWIDPFKLQKQVDVMRKYPHVGFCFCGARFYHGIEDKWEVWDKDLSGFKPGLISSRHYVLWTMFGKEPLKGARLSEFWQMTATFLVRTSVLNQAKGTFDIFSWRLMVGDAVLCIGVGGCSDVYYIADQVAVYRQVPSGTTISRSGYCNRDTLLVRFYYFKKIFDGNWSDIPDRTVDSYVRASFPLIRKICGEKHVRYLLRNELRQDVVAHVMLRRRNRWWTRCFLRNKKMTGWRRCIDVLWREWICGAKVSANLVTLYNDSGCCVDNRRVDRKSLWRLSILFLKKMAS